MKKKLVSMLLAAAMCVTAFAGCGSSTGDDAKGDDTAKEDKEYSTRICFCTLYGT